MTKFLDYFPVVEYPGFGRVRDFTPSLRLKGVENTLPFEQPAGSRPDVIADKYYGDPVLEWLLYAANEVEGPRELIYLDEEQFNAMIVRVYGSVDAAEQLTKYYRHNHRSDLGSVLTEGQYEALPTAVKPLFDVKQDLRGNIVGYVRKKSDIFRSTNFTQKVTVTNAASLSKGDVVEFKQSSTINGTGEIALVDGADIYVHHIRGTVTANTLSDVAIVSSVVASTNITVDEAAYFERVSMLTYLEELNEGKRQINVIDNREAQAVVQQLIDAF